MKTWHTVALVILNLALLPWTFQLARYMAKGKPDFIGGCILFVVLPLMHFYFTALVSCVFHKITQRGQPRP